MWLSESGTRGHVLARNGPVGALALSPDGRFLAAAEPARVAVRRFAWPPSPVEVTATVGQVLRGDVFFLTGAEVTDDHAGVRTLAFEPAGELVAAGTHDGSVMVWRPGAGADTGRAAVHDGPVITVAFTGGGSRLVSVGSDGSIRFWRWRR
jgi:WD40 repeat protein